MAISCPRKTVSVIPGKGLPTRRPIWLMTNLPRHRRRRPASCQVVALREQRRVLVVHHLRGQAAAERHLHDVEAERARRRRELAEVNLHRAAQRAPLALVHRLETVHERALGPRLDLDKYEHVAVAAHEVDLVALVARAPPVA